jgi:peptidoglycan/LPS O-acetylase OafA/YrhL
MQYLSIELAWWFNVGVQIFLCMSGYLYGKKEKITDELTFYKKNFTKILVDYYVVIIPVIFLILLIIPEQISIITIAKSLLTCGTLSGGGHLWYIPYCLFCYLITPFLSRYFEKKEHIFMRFLVLSIFSVVFIEAFLTYFNAAWIFCYVLGFFLGRIVEGEKVNLYSKMSVLIVIGAFVFNTIQVIQDYVIKFEFNGIFASLYDRFCNYAHVLLGVALFVIFKSLFSRAFKNGYPDFIKKICSYSDKYSYDIYLVHQFIILGPFSLMTLTGVLGLNLALIVIIVVVAAVVVNLISALIKRQIAVIGKK